MCTESFGTFGNGTQAPVVQRVDSTIQWMTQKILVGFICWIPLSEIWTTSARWTIRRSLTILWFEIKISWNFQHPSVEGPWNDLESWRFYACAQPKCKQVALSDRRRNKGQLTDRSGGTTALKLTDWNWKGHVLTHVLMSLPKHWEKYNLSADNAFILLVTNCDSLSPLTKPKITSLKKITFHYYQPKVRHLIHFLDIMTI